MPSPGQGRKQDFSRHLAANAYPNVVRVRGVSHHLQQPNDRRMAWFVEMRNTFICRSIATEYWIKSFVPILKKSTSRASRSAMMAAAGTSIITPISSSSWNGWPSQRSSFLHSSTICKPRRTSSRPEIIGTSS
jgi:hypothetical protein